MDFTCVLHKFIKNKSLVNNIHKSQTRSETRNVYMDEISIQRKFPSDVLTVLNPMICLLMTYNSKLYIHAQVTPIPNSCREL